MKRLALFCLLGLSLLGLLLAGDSQIARRLGPARLAPADASGQPGPQPIPAPSTPTIQLVGSYDGDVRDLPPVASIRRPDAAEEDHGPPSRKPPPTSPVRGQRSLAVTAAAPTTDVSFQGLSYGAGTPPDATGDVGPNHYVEAVNTSVGIYSKVGSTLATFTFNTLWSGVGTTPCDGSNRGDPTVVYDPMGDRWIVADFAFVGNSPPYYECIAVSKTGNPVTGGWWFYALRADDATHPWMHDYPKMGIWPGSLLMTANMFSPSAYQAPRIWAINLADIESGSGSARSIVRDLSGTYFSLLPVNLRGALPPSGSPAYFVAEDLYYWGFDVWRWTIDWAAGTSTFSSPTLVSQTPYVYIANDFVPQPGTTQRLDVLDDRLMMQAQYRNLGGVESIWVAHTVGTSSPSAAAIQWAQFNVTGGTVVTTPVQEGIWSGGGDGLHRWIPSLAVDRDGNMAVGYSAGDASTYASIRYAGRLSSDAAGTLGQGEAILQAGTTSQTYLGRWGDYFSMSVDPTDDCTFWFVGEYIASGTGRWTTRIGSFKYPSCGVPLPTITGLSTTSGGVGTAFTVTGANFTAPATCSINLVPATVCEVKSATSIVTSVPSGASSGPVRVTMRGVTAASATNFTVGATPVVPGVGSFSPTAGVAGNAITVTGTNLAGATDVKIGTTSALSWTVIAPTQLAVTVPAGATSGRISVTTAGGTGTSSGTLTVYVQPTVTSVAPSAQIAGLSIVITGTGFQAVSGVTIGGVSATFTPPATTTSITAVVPPGASSGTVTVTNPAGSGSGGSFTRLRYTATQLSAGTSHSCTSVSGGSLRCWGLNSSGQLGDGGTTQRATSVEASGLSGVTSVSAGGAFTCAVVNPGASGEAWCAGAGGNGQLGIGVTQTSSTTFVRVLASAGTPLSGVTAVATGTTHACALLSSGRVRCWGLNSSGQLGDGSTTQRLYPVEVTTAASTPIEGVTQIAARGNTTCALLSSGAVRCWGSNGSGQIGDNSTTNRTRATQVSGLTSGVTQVAVGGSHTCAVLSTGQARCWGLNSSRQLADGTTTTRRTPVAVLSAAGTSLTGVTSLTAGTAFTCALLSDQTARCWGSDANGQLGNASTTTPTYPVVVRGVGGTGTLSGITAISAGGSHVVALAGGTLSAWGLNTNAQLGDNTVTQRTSPVAVLGF